jgi:hypothetical protein
MIPFAQHVIPMATNTSVPPPTYNYTTYDQNANANYNDYPPSTSHNCTTLDLSRLQANTAVGHHSNVNGGKQKNTIASTRNKQTTNVTNRSNGIVKQNERAATTTDTTGVVEIRCDAQTTLQRQWRPAMQKGRPQRTTNANRYTN